jgi:molybdopterin biosynthesis enzyme
MTAANCFIILEEEWSDVGAGESVWVEPFQPL